MLTRRKLLTFGTGAALATGGGLYLRSGQTRYYDGPVSDHFDGERFFDVHGVSDKSINDRLTFWTTRYPANWPEQAPSPFADKPPRRVDDRTLRISFVGHASILLQTGGKNILIDPVWSNRASPFTFVGPQRRNAPGVSFDLLPPLDFVLVSHGHYDHMDVATLSAIATPHRARVITPLGNDAIMKAHDSTIAAEGHDWYQRVDLAPGFSVTQAPMRHWTARTLMDRNKALWSAFILDTPAGRIYHVGDSGYGTGHHFKEAREKFGPFKLAILPIGAYEPRWFMQDQHMNPLEAVKAFEDTGAELGLAHHFGTFRMAGEAYGEPEREHDLALKGAGIPPEQFRRLRPGEVWEI
jgi:L-ascorbate metabolism protein UlaG (beta-lactamase superfamily)